MNAILAIIVSFILLILLKPFNVGLVQPLVKRLPGVRYFHPSKPCCWRGKGSIMVGMFVCLCLASQKPSEQEFLFLPERIQVLSSGGNKKLPLGRLFASETHITQTQPP
jgi:hypothetical protein